MSGFKFSFKKTVEKPVIKPTSFQLISKEEEDNKQEKIEFITSICDNKIVSKEVPIEKVELVIPIKESKRRKLLYKSREKEAFNKEIKDEYKREIKDECKGKIKNELTVKISPIKIKKERDDFENQMDLDELAKRELINDALGSPKRVKKENDLTIKLNENNCKEEPENNDEEIEDADYSKISPDDFGMALLRGMCKKEEDLAEDKIYEPKASCGGVGLGFESHLKREKLKNAKKQFSKRYLPGENDEEDLVEKKNLDEFLDNEIKVGSLVCIEYGKNKGYYGKIVSINEDITRCEVQLSLSKEIDSLPINLVRIVSKKEYNKESKVLNRSKYNRYNDFNKNKDR